MFNTKLNRILIIKSSYADLSGTGTINSIRMTGIYYRGIFYSLDLESTPPTLNRLPGFPRHRMNNFSLIKTLGYSKGMLCMEARNYSKCGWPHIFFGNPSTGYYKIIPDPLVYGPRIVGFGYDSFTDDYKFVRIDNTTRHPYIYSLKSNSWTTNEHSRSDKLKSALEDRTFQGYKLKSALEDRTFQGYVSEGCFVDSSIYWYEDESLIKFDLKEEKFEEMDLPRGFVEGIIKLRAVEGSLCLIDSLPQKYHSGKDIDVDMWLLKWREEEKKKNIVKKKYFFTVLLSLRDIRADNIYPLSLTKDGKVICSVEYENEVKDASRPILVNPNTGSYKDFPVSGINSGIFRELIFKSYYSGFINTFVSHNVH